MTELKEAIRTRALACGFDVVGFTRAEADPKDARHLDQYLAEGRHGDMAWMARTAERRADPKALWPEARSVICLGVNYGPAEDPRSVHGEPERGAISVYARGRDYHEVLKKRLKTFARWLGEEHGCAVKVFVDTAPVMEKPLAMRAGLGWIGKHTNLVSRRFGSWLFLGEVFTTLELPADPPELDHCGSCDACLRACPTGALPEPYRIEPRRCISYLTIEHEGEIAPEIAGAFGNRIYGCDDCLAACPWNKFAAPTPHLALQARADLAAPQLTDLADLDEASFRARFSGTAIKRSGRNRMLLNVRIAIANAHLKAAPHANALRTKAQPGAARPQPREYVLAPDKDVRWRHRFLHEGGKDTASVAQTPRIELRSTRPGAPNSRYFVASTLANWLSASRCRSFGICVKLRASSRHIRCRTVKSPSPPCPSKPSKK